jgi:hypothetical protein
MKMTEMKYSESKPVRLTRLVFCPIIHNLIPRNFAVFCTLCTQKEAESSARDVETRRRTEERRIIRGDIEIERRKDKNRRVMEVEVCRGPGSIKAERPEQTEEIEIALGTLLMKHIYRGKPVEELIIENIKKQRKEGKRQEGKR